MLKLDKATNEKKKMKWKKKLVNLLSQIRNMFFVDRQIYRLAQQHRVRTHSNRWWWRLHGRSLQIEISFYNGIFSNERFLDYEKNCKKKSKACYGFTSEYSLFFHNLEFYINLMHTQLLSHWIHLQFFPLSFVVIPFNSIWW